MCHFLAFFPPPFSFLIFGRSIYYNGSPILIGVFLLFLLFIIIREENGIGDGLNIHDLRGILRDSKGEITALFQHETSIILGILEETFVKPSVRDDGLTPGEGGREMLGEEWLGG